jgi:N-acetylated-alpha-linked acidic dipeptidase
VARDVPDPSGGGASALDAARQHHRQERTRDTTGAGPDSAFTIGALGSGSDYTGFIDHLGVASLDVRYGGAVQDGVYHSAYDDYTFYLRWLDTALTAEVAEARTVGTALLRLADAPVLPFEFRTAARRYRGYADEIARLAHGNDTTRALDLAPLVRAVSRLDSAAQRYEAALAPLEALTAAQVSARAAALDRVNRMLYRTERAMTDTAGLPRRPWFRNLIYAPGLYTGYGVKTMPGIREAVELRRLDEAQAEAARVTAAVERLADELDHVTAALGEALK